jgi:hypothetical protein
VVRAPTPAKVIWQSQSMPPSPVTMVHDRQMMPRAKAWGKRPTQYPLTMTGSKETITMSNRGPAYLPTKLSDAVSTTLLVEPARRLSP